MDNFSPIRLTSSSLRLLKLSYIKNYFQQPPSITNAWYYHRLPMLISFHTEIPTQGPLRHTAWLFSLLYLTQQRGSRMLEFSLLSHLYSQIHLLCKSACRLAEFCQDKNFDKGIFTVKTLLSQVRFQTWRLFKTREKKNFLSLTFTPPCFLPIDHTSLGSILVWLNIPDFRSLMLITILDSDTFDSG